MSALLAIVERASETNILLAEDYLARNPVGDQGAPRRARHRRPAARSNTSRSARESGLLAVELAGELRNLWPRRVPGCLKDRRDVGVGDEVLPALRVPVEEHPDPALLIRVAKDVRTLGPVLLSLLEACGREDTPPAVEILDLASLRETLSPPP